MRKITEQAIRAFRNNEKFSSSNTQIIMEDQKTKMYLHGNLIAYKEDGKLFISTCGWSSNTTKERLNGLEGVSIYQKNWNWYLNGKEWNGKMIEVK